MPTAFPEANVADWRSWRVEVGDVPPWGSAHLAAPPDFGHGAGLSWSGGLVALAWGEARLLLAPGAVGALELARLVASARRPAMVRILRVAAEPGDFPDLLLWEGAARSADLVAGGLLELRAEVEVPGSHVGMCRDLAALPGHSSAPPGTWLPQVFGTCQGVRPVLLRAPAERNRLLGPLAHDADVVQLRETVDWSAPGAVQVADEVVFFDVIEGGNQLGSEGHPVTRYTRRDHPDRAEVWLLDVGGIAWLACDHPAEVVLVTAAREPGGPPVEGLTASVEEFHGRDATLLRGLVMPTERTESSVAAVRSALFGYAGHWSLTGASNALRGAQAFSAHDQSQGAILSSSHAVLEADWVGNLARTLWRHDRIASACLAFELTPHAGWDADTLLRVTVTRDGASVEKTFSFAEEVADLVGLLADGNLAVAPLAARPWRFDVFAATGGWSSPAAALDGIAAGSPAICVRSGSDETLELRAVRPWPGEAEPVMNLRIGLLVASPDGAKFKIRAADGDGLDIESDSIAPGATPELAEFPVELAAPMDARALLAALTVEVIAHFDGTIELHEAWIDVGIASPAQATPLGVRASQRLLHVDFTEFLQGPFDWAAFDGAAPRFRVRMELEDAPAYAPAAIARVHWRIEGFPAAVRPTSEIAATVEGRLASADGTAHPIEVARLLLEGGDFAGLTVADDAEAAWEEASARVDDHGVRYRAVVADARTVAGALAASCGEAATILVHGPNGWVPRALPLSPEAVETPEAPASVSGFTALRISGTAPGAARPPRVLLAANSPGLAWTEDDADAAGVANARWVDAGGEATLRAAQMWCSRGRASMRREHAPGEPIPLPGDGMRHADGHHGIVRSTRREAGRFEVELDSTNTLEPLWAQGSWLIAHAPAGRAILFTHDRRIVAEIDAAGNFAAAGAIETAPMTAPGAAPVEIDAGGELLLGAVEGEEGSAVRIAAAGSVLTTHAITTMAAPGAGAGPVWHAAAGVVSACPAGTETVWRLTSAGLEICGAARNSRRL